MNEWLFQKGLSVQRIKQKKSQNITKTSFFQIYWNYYHQAWKFSDKNSDIFHISTRRGGSNEYPQSIFLSRNKKNNV